MAQRTLRALLFVVAISAILIAPRVGRTFASGDWFAAAALPVALRDLAATTGTDGRIYALGGANSGGDSLTTAEVYDPTTDAWSALPPMPTGRQGLGAATGADGRIYAVGGATGEVASNAVEAYTPSTNRWAALAPLPVAREVFAAVAAPGPDGRTRIYAIGGYNGSAPLDSVEAYDPTTNAWSEMAPMPTARYDIAAALGPDGRIYVMGGFAAGLSMLTTVEAYDPIANTWTTVAPLPGQRYALAAATGRDGRIYAIGGDDNSLRSTTSVDVYDPQANVWSAGPALTTARSFVGAVASLDGRLFAIGGEDANSQPLSSVEAYTVPLATATPDASPTVTATGTATATPTSTSTPTATATATPTPTATATPVAWGFWTALPPMPTARDALAVATGPGPDGRIYAIGGNSANSFLSVVEAYDPATNQWTTVTSLPNALYGPAAATGPDGDIYVVGGYGCTGSGCAFTANVERYDPVANAWTSVAPMPTPRYALAVVTGRDGRIYAMGGSNAIGYLNTVEAYDPSTNSWSTVAPMSTIREFFGAAVGSDGRIYAVGGSNPSSVALNSVEAYAPASNTWTAVAPLPVTADSMAVAAGPDGRIYAFGGASGVSTHLSEVYDPAANAWSQMAPLPTERCCLAAVRGPDGRIYTLGGYASNLSAFLPTAEALTIPGGPWPTPTAVPPPPPSAPKGVAATINQRGQVTVSWAPPAGATGYAVHRVDRDPAPLATISSGSATRYIDANLACDNGTATAVHSYYVVAVYSNGSSPPSAIVKGHAVPCAPQQRQATGAPRRAAPSAPDSPPRPRSAAPQA